MTPTEDSSDTPRQTRPARLLFLERVTAGVLLLVLVCVGWITLTSAQPSWLRLASEENEAIVVLALLTASLVLVSGVALLDTVQGRLVETGDMPEPGKEST